MISEFHKGNIMAICLFSLFATMAWVFSNDIRVICLISFVLSGGIFLLSLYLARAKTDLKDTLLDVLPLVLSFALFPFFHLYCYELCIGTFCTLFSTLVQIFGTLLGLLLVAFFPIRDYMKRLKPEKENDKKSLDSITEVTNNLFYESIISMIVIVSYSIIILALSPYIITTGVFGEVIFYFGGITIPIITISNLKNLIIFCIYTKF